jgi:hypothetical protein
LLGSPAKVNASWPEVLEPGLIELMLLLLGLRSIQGTATSFPPLELSVEEVADGEVLVVLGLAVELVEIAAKSILPEAGFSTRSVMVPNVWP